MSNTSLSDRMKEYEAVTRFTLPRRTHTILRVDGRAFHTYLRDADKPFDMTFVRDMDSVAQALCAEITGTVFAYAQSDEISLLIRDDASVNTEPWFGGVIQKMTSVAASVATARLNQMRPSGLGLFDARVFTIPDPVEVANYFLHRQQDALRNSISMVAQAFFAPEQLHGLCGEEMQALLYTVHGVSWANDYPTSCQDGRVCVRESYTEDVTYTDGRTGEEVTVTAQRSRWVIQDAVRFSADSDQWLAHMIQGETHDL